MPPAELHDLSLQIGRLLAEAENARRSREVMHQRMDALARQYDELSGVLHDVAAMRPEVQHYAAARQRIAGAMALLTLIAGGIGALASFAVNFIQR